MTSFVRTLNAAEVAETARAVADGYEVATMWHPGQAVCPAELARNPATIPTALTMYVPVNKTNWSGTTCSDCGQTLGPEG